jgi:putative chitobiose transport system permease protein
VVVPFSVSAFGVFMCRQAFLAIPDETEEAAIMDGAGPADLVERHDPPRGADARDARAVQHHLRLVRSALAADDPPERRRFTLPVAINRLMGLFATNPRVAYAASVMALAPIVLFFFAIQRFLTPQLFAGAVK